MSGRTDGLKLKGQETHKIWISLVSHQFIVLNDKIKNIINCTVRDRCWGYYFSSCFLKQYFHIVPSFWTGPSSDFWYTLIKAWSVVTEQTWTSGKDKLLKLQGRGGRKERERLISVLLWNASNWLSQLESVVSAGGIIICPYRHWSFSC